jgi:hypothetical protein
MKAKPGMILGIVADKTMMGGSERGKMTTGDVM